jgi:hypothetical protein
VFRGIDLFGGGRAPSEDLVLKDLTIEQNTFSDYTDFGMYISWDFRRINIIRNKIFGNPSILGNAIWVGIGVESLLVKDNYIRDSGRIGIEVFYPDSMWDKVDGGFSGSQGGIIPRVNDPGSFTHAAAGVIVEGNVVHNSRTTAISVTGSPMAQIIGNQVYRYQFVGIEYVGEGNMNALPALPVASIDSPALIANNVVREAILPVGQQNAVLAGISVDQTQYALVTGNLVQDVPQANSNCSGIFIGDGYNNVVQGNHLIKAGAYYIRSFRSTGDRKSVV